MYKLYKLTSNPYQTSSQRVITEFLKEGSHVDALVLYALDKDLIELAKALRKLPDVYNNKIMHVIGEFYLLGTQEEF